MDSQTLIGEDIRRGRRILDSLKAAGVALEGAFWRHDPDRENWRLVLASDGARGSSRAIRMTAAETLRPGELFELDFVAPDDTDFQAVSKADGVDYDDGKRIRHAFIDGRYFDDAFVYSL